jgi:hypothetical protein
VRTGPEQALTDRSRLARGPGSKPSVVPAEMIRALALPPNLHRRTLAFTPLSAHIPLRHGRVPVHRGRVRRVRVSAAIREISAAVRRSRSMASISNTRVGARLEHQVLYAVSSSSRSPKV